MTVLNTFQQQMSGSKRMKFISTHKLKLREGKTKLQMSCDQPIQHQ